METGYVTIDEGLRRLRASAASMKIFGSEAHGYLTNPPLSEMAIREFEDRHHVTLPAEYRGFLTNIGNGGAGPAYGLFRLGEMDDGFGHKCWAESDGFVGILSEPFPHTSVWNNLSEKPVFDETRENDVEYEDEYWRQMDAWEERVYWNTANVNGAVPICHLGCAYRQWLIVTGPEAGNVWDDNRTDYDGIKPLQKAGYQRITFLHWYRSWLDDVLGQLS